MKSMDPARRRALLIERARLMPRPLSETSALAASILLTVDRRGSITIRDAVQLFGRPARLVVRQLASEASDRRDRLLAPSLPTDEPAPGDRDEVILTSAGRRVCAQLDHLAYVVSTFEPTKRERARAGRRS